MAPTPKECDFLVIGGGSGGLAAARRASGMYGAKAVVIEHARLGGTCVNVGCVPKKVSWYASSIAETIRHDAKSYGFSVKETGAFDWKLFKEKRDAYVKRLNGIYERNLGNDKVEYLHGDATFKSKNTVNVKLDDGSIQEVNAKKVLIAVGGRPNKVGIEGEELGFNSDGFFELEHQPKKVAVVGAGYIAIELAGMFNGLGSETHLFIRHDTFLRNFDPMVQESLGGEYERQGVHIHKKSSPTKIEDLGNGSKRVHYKDGSGKESTLDVDGILWAVGRVPETDKCNIEVTGVELDKKGRVKVDKFQNTNVENIYALGDACDSGYELTPVAIAAGRRLADRLFGNKPDSHLSYENVPSVVFSHPEVGTIGLTEPQAREKFGDDAIKIYKDVGYGSLYNSMLDQERKTLTSYKLVCAGKEEKVVGLHILGPGSSEALQGFGVAIKMGATKKDFDSCVAIHPTSAEELVTLK